MAVSYKKDSKSVTSQLFEINKDSFESMDKEQAIYHALELGWLEGLEHGCDIARDIIREMEIIL